MFCSSFMKKQVIEKYVFKMKSMLSKPKLNFNIKIICLQEYVMLVTQGYSNALWESRAMEILSLFFNTFNSMAAL